MSNEVKKEIETFISRMGFGELIEGIDIHQGTASRFCVRLKGEANMLIGERGSNLQAIEQLVKKIIRKKYQNEDQFTLDVNDYRLKKLEDLKQDVKTAAKEVRVYKRKASLRPMSSFERRIVHLLLAEYPDLVTESVGEEPERKVIVKPYQE